MTESSGEVVIENLLSHPPQVLILLPFALGLLSLYVRRQSFRDAIL